jgi:hypothetical protein
MGMEAAAKIAEASASALYDTDPHYWATQFSGSEKARFGDVRAYGLPAYTRAVNRAEIVAAAIRAEIATPSPDDAFSDGPDMGVKEGVMPGDLNP